MTNKYGTEGREATPMIKPPPRRDSFVRLSKKRKFEIKMSLKDCSYSPSHFHELCAYFDDDSELQSLKPRLLGSHTALELAAVLFEVWKVATEDQFAWFVGTFEQKMQLENEQFFDEALTKFTELCDTYEC